MVTIKLTNTKTRRKEVFVPLDPKNVRMYVCGPTVYDRAHLGNARPVVVFDVLYRLLRHVYGEGHVTYVRNFTDVDDKINAEALRRQRAGAPGTMEELIRGRTEETIAWYHADMDALGALRPDHAPRATEFVPQMVAMIAGLVTSGHAYAAEGHVLFRVRSYAKYGALSGRSVDDMIAGARVEVAPYKEDPMDFVLWKPSSDQEPGWPSPWGRGRPGWHIECSAMAQELFGESFDIHAGGIDLQFPHHENEIAQSACAHPHGEFARVWMHNEMLQVEGKKMSKSLGNFFTVRDLLEQGIRGDEIRHVLLSTHYSKPMDWTSEKAKQAKDELHWWRMATAKIEDIGPPPSLIEALADDLNTSDALTVMRALFDVGDFHGLRAGMAVLGFGRIVSARGVAVGGSVAFGGLISSADVEVDPNHARVLAEVRERLLDVRSNALESKDFSAVDSLKAKITAAGVEVRMSKGGVELVPGPNFDAAKLEALK
jgi:cysteinyl-tRNA synthetase